MRVLYLITLLCLAFGAWGQENAYKGKTEQKALKMAYNLLKVYYPSNDLCVSDTIRDLDDWIFYAKEVDIENKKYFESYRLAKRGYDKPVYSKHISKLFENEGCDPCQAKYVADFSAPYRNFILCEILPIDRMIGMRGCPEIYTFLFKYNEEGEIILMNRHTLNVD